MHSPIYRSIKDIFSLQVEVKNDLTRVRTIWRMNKHDQKIKVLTTHSDIQKLIKGKSHLYWYELKQEQSRLCSLSFSKIYKDKELSKKDYKCRKAIFPNTLSIIGEEPIKDYKYTKNIWMSLKTEKLTGDNYSIIKINTETNKASRVHIKEGGTQFHMLKLKISITY